MRRLLIRAGKSPFTPVGAETTFAQDVYGSNTGNYVFQHSVWRALSVPGSTLVANHALTERRTASAGDIRYMNEEFDAFVVPLANAFRLSFAGQLDRLTDTIERLSIPVVVVGVGAQSHTNMRTSRLKPIESSVKGFMRAVLDRSASVGVRGEFTADYLAELGFGDQHVDVIGCPSLFLHGPDHRIDKPDIAFDADTPLAINLSPVSAPKGGGEFVSRQAEKYRDLLYVMQNSRELDLLLWGRPMRAIEDPRVPDHMGHFMYQQDRLRLFLDAWAWMDFLRTRDFVYGTRIHGNITALLAGTPSYVLAHDSRTLELARYHHIPHRLARRVDPDWDAAELYAEADYGAFNQAMPEHFATYTAFLQRNGLDHIWNHDGDDNGFFDTIAEQTFPAPVHSLLRPDGREMASRIRWLQEGFTFSPSSHPDAMPYDFRPPSSQSIVPAAALRRRAWHELVGEIRGRLRNRLGSP